MVVVTGAVQTQAWEDKVRLRWSRPWDPIGPFMRRQANGETLAHCVLLEPHGRVRRDGVSLALFFVAEQ